MKSLILLCLLMSFAVNAKAQVEIGQSVSIRNDYDTALNKLYWGRGTDDYECRGQRLAWTPGGKIAPGDEFFIDQVVSGSKKLLAPALALPEYVGYTAIVLKSRSGMVVQISCQTSEAFMMEGKAQSKAISSEDLLTMFDRVLTY